GNALPGERPPHRELRDDARAGDRSCPPRACVQPSLGGHSAGGSLRTEIEVEILDGFDEAVFGVEEGREGGEGGELVAGVGAGAGDGGEDVAGLDDDDARGIAMEVGHEGFAGGLALPGAALGDVVDEAGGGAALGEPVDGGLEAPDEDAVALFGELADGEGDAAIGVEVEVGDVGELAVHRGAILEGWTIEEVGDANAGAL